MPKAVERAAKRSEFVAAGMAVIAHEGLSAATLRRIAAEAGCTTGAITHYYSGREALLIDLLRSVHYAAGARMMDVARSARSDVDRLERVLLESLPLDAVRMLEWKVWLAFWGAAPGEASLAAENARRYDEWRGLVETLLAPFCADHRQTQREASLLVALIDGFGTRLALLPDAYESLAEAQDQVASDLRAYLRERIESQG